MTTLFSIFALRGRDRDNPSLRGRSKGVGGDEMSLNKVMTSADAALAKAAGESEVKDGCAPEIRR